jgi:hypothetical protein
MSGTSTASEEFTAGLHDLIAASRERGLSDDEIISELADAAEALREGLS